LKFKRSAHSGIDLLVRLGAWTKLEDLVVNDNMQQGEGWEDQNSLFQSNFA